MSKKHKADGPEQEITSDGSNLVEQEAAGTPEAADVKETEKPAKKPRKKRAPKVAEPEAEPVAEIAITEDVEPAIAAPEVEEPDEVESADIAAESEKEGDEEREPRPEGKLERLQKILAQAGIASRRHAEELITEGRVQVNGKVVNVLGSKADPEHDHIRVDGKLLHGAERKRYFVLNKPRGYVTTVTDPEGRPTVMEFFSKLGERLYPVGRLDFQSEGLLLVTNDGELANSLTKAASGVEKTYLVKVAGQPSEEMLDRLREGVAIERGRLGEGKVRTAPARVQQIRPGDNPWYEVVLIEGRNRELRKMFEEIGHHVEKIRRVGYGPLVLDVEPGKIRELELEEVDALRRTAAGKLKPRRMKSTYMLPKEAGQSTEERMAKEAARREKRGRRPFTRDNRAERFSGPPSRERQPEGAGGFRRPPSAGHAGGLGRAGTGREDAGRGFDRPVAGRGAGFGAREGRAGAGRPSAGGPGSGGTGGFRRDAGRGGRPFAGKPEFGDRPRRSGPATDRPQRAFEPRGGARTERPAFEGKPRFERRPPSGEGSFKGERGPRKDFSGGERKPFTPRGEGAGRGPARSNERSFEKRDFKPRPPRAEGAGFERGARGKTFGSDRPREGGATGRGPSPRPFRERGSAPAKPFAKKFDRPASGAGKFGDRAAGGTPRSGSGGVRPRPASGSGFGAGPGAGAGAKSGPPRFRTGKQTNRPEGRGFGGARPSGTRPSGPSSGGSRPTGSRTGGGRPGGSRPGGSRPGGSRPGGSRSGGARPGGARRSGPRPGGQGSGGRKRG